MTKDYSQVKPYSGPKPPAKSNTQTLAQMLANNLPSIRSALPKHLTAERIARVAINYISKNPQLQNCTPASLCGAIMEASSLGLEIDLRGLAYLVPYGNTAQLQIGYKGLIDLALRSGKVKQIFTDVIGENDTYDVIMGLEPQLIHKPNLAGRGQIIAAYAIAVMSDGSKQFVIVNHDDIEKVKKASKTAKSGPWVDWYEAMAMKVAVKRLCKMLPLSPEIQKATSLDDAIDAGIEQVFETAIETPEPAPIPEREEVTKEEQQAIQQEETKQEYEFECPKTGNRIKEEACKDCEVFHGCPQWEAV